MQASGILRFSGFAAISAIRFQKINGMFVESLLALENSQNSDLCDPQFIKERYLWPIHYVGLGVTRS